MCGTKEKAGAASSKGKKKGACGNPDCTCSSCKFVKGREKEKLKNMHIFFQFENKE
jgi:hypothetical protein